MINSSIITGIICIITSIILFLTKIPYTYSIIFLLFGIILILNSKNENKIEERKDLK
ncbi:MAG: hypothetical protein PHX15_00440 [Candidatus Nanoarchaeia archaeon]|jgi:hypothetical protein|nr:hypothetical protein [Candidatus Nanoarchaeia archaeon]MDD3993652.1 hypothetical protein [Candidatus Nanoarchaeia archaeon]MDD4563609.1 hypothetical protein [Candidatus Nanoarchaeia archaeon]